jgi:hypothetical protein
MLKLEDINFSSDPHTADTAALKLQAYDANNQLSFPTTLAVPTNISHEWQWRQHCQKEKLLQ